MKTLAPIIILASLLTACGGGGGGSTSGSLPSTRPAGTVSGVAFDGAVSGGTVNIYDFSGGSKGALLGTGRTETDGQYAVPLVTPDKPILVEIVGGSYLEEATGIQVQLDTAQGQRLAAVQPYQSGVSTTMNATFFTTLASGLAEYLVESQGLSVSDAVQTANQQLSGWAGFDILKTSPQNVANAANASAVLTERLKAGFMAAAISEMTRQVSVDAGQAEHSTWTSIAFIQTAYADIRADGVLDGVGAAGAVSLGDAALDGNTYRATVAERMLQFVGGERNSTGLGFEEVLPFATTLGQHAGETFGGTAPSVDFTVVKPTVTQFLPADGQTVSGNTDASALASDPFGLTVADFFVGDQLVTSASADSGSPSSFIDTLNFSDGPHLVSIEVTNLLGNTTRVEHTVTFANASAVSGAAFDGLIIDGDVNIYDFTGATKGVLLGTGKTDNQGLYSVSIISPSRPILIEIEGGFYLEEASGLKVQMDRTKNYKLSAVQIYQSGVPVTMNATFFTTVATGLVEYLVQTRGNAINNAILQANQQVSSWAGFDIETTVPVDVSLPSSVTSILTDEHRYGFTAAAISELTRQVNVDAGEPAHRVWPSIAFIRAAYDDVRVDGLLDGRGPAGAVTLGNLSLTADAYRATLAERLMQFVVSDKNNTALGFDQVLPFATALNAFAGSVFSSQPARDFKATIAPTLTQFLPVEGDTVKGDVELSVILSDIFGIQAVQYFVDDSLVATASNPLSPAELYSTFDLSNGPHTFSVQATNLLGNTTVVDHTIAVANGTVSVGVPALVDEFNCVYNVAINDGAGVGIESVTKDGVSVASNLPGSSTLQLSTDNTLVTCIAVNITAVDNIGNTGTRTFGADFFNTGRGTPRRCRIVGSC